MQGGLWRFWGTPARQRALPHQIWLARLVLLQLQPLAVVEQGRATGVGYHPEVGKSAVAVPFVEHAQ